MQYKGNVKIDDFLQGNSLLYSIHKCLSIGTPLPHPFIGLCHQGPSHSHNTQPPT